MNRRQPRRHAVAVATPHPAALRLLQLLLVLATPACTAAVESADLLLAGGPVVTMDDARTVATAVAVRDGQIVWIGDAEAAEEWAGPATRSVDLAGRMLLPGFQDAHVHLLSSGVEMGECDLSGSADVQEVFARIGACAEALGPDDWVRGGGFELPIFPGGNPRAAKLDEIVGDRPAYLTSSDGHSAWVSSRALEIAGVTAATPDPPAGRIEREATGQPTGTLRETAAELVSRHLPRHTPEELDAGLRRGLEQAARFGITAAQEASAGRAEMVAYAGAAAAGGLTARLSVSLLATPAGGLEQVRELVRLRAQYTGIPDLRVETVKIFADGVLEGQTAAVLEPYVGQPGYRGEANYEHDDLVALITALDAEGFQVHVHAIGDRAIRDALDGFESARRVNGMRDSRHHIAHAQLIHPDDLPRFAALGVYANFSPLWAYADAFVTELTDPFLGPVRARWQYPLGDLARSGATLVFGSDWSVSSLDPLLGMQVGMTRQAPDGSGEPWLPEQRLDIDTMLAGYTRNAARVNFLEQTTGTIEVGKAADLVVLDRDIRAVDAGQVGSARVLMTVLGGRVVYESGSS